MPIELLSFPNELLLQIAAALELSVHVSRLSRTNQRLHILLHSLVFQCNVRNCKSSGLLWASQYGRDDVIEQLLAFGANVQVTGRRGGTAEQTPLTISVRAGHKSIVERLLRCEEMKI